MRALLSSVFIALAGAIPFSVFAQSTLPADTLATDSVVTNPALVKTPVAALRNFAWTKKDPIAFQLYAGVSALNTLRGRVPSLSIGSDPAFASGGVRGGGTMLVIDGLPYHNSISSFYNLNTFEYETLYALPGGNSATAYGGTASSGAVFLTSKSGKDLAGPSVEFNSSPAILWNESAGQNDHTWHLTNAVAFANDFGAADLRASYNATFTPANGQPGAMKSGLHNVRINTGVDIARDFSARIILDGMFNKGTASFASGQATQTTNEAIVKNLQANLLLTYQPLSWLTLSSQSSLSDIGLESHVRSSILIDGEREDERFFANLFASAKKALTPNTGFQAFAGLQHEDQEASMSRWQQTPGTINYMWQRTEYKTTALVGGVSLSHKNYLFADATYRLDNFSALPGADDQTSWSTGASFVFSELLPGSKKYFTSGKVRVSWGRSGVFDASQYPARLNSATTGFPNPNIIVIPNPSLSPVTGRTMFETGTDLGFLGDRLGLNVTWYRDVNDQTIVQLLAPGSSGFQYTFVDLGETRVQGWESVLIFRSLTRERAALTTSLTFTSAKTTVGEQQPGSEPGISLGNPNPDWIGSVLNQLRLGNFFTTFLADVRSGGDVVIFSGSSLTIVDTSHIMMRDLSIGYSLPHGNIFTNATVSLSGRNLWVMHVEDGRFREHLFGYYRSIALSVTLGF